MKFTIATLTAVMLSLTTVDVNAVKIHTTMKQKKAIAKHSIPDDVALFMDDIEQPEIDEDEIEDFLNALEYDAEIDWDHVEEDYEDYQDCESEDKAKSEDKSKPEAEDKSEDKAEAKSEDKAEAKPEVDTPVLATWDTLSCNPGEFEIAGTCEICPAGHMSYNDSQSCTLCPDNYYSAAGSAECTICPDGFSSISPAAFCDSMEEASQLAQVTEDISQFCEAGQYMYAEVCYDCWAGTFSTYGATACHECPENFTSDPKANECARCPEGYDTNGKEGQSSCSVHEPTKQEEKEAKKEEKAEKKAEKKAE